MSSTVGLAANVKVVSTSPVLPSPAMRQILAVRSADTVRICNNHTGCSETASSSKETHDYFALFEGFQEITACPDP
jgi:hypothetical protein